MSDPNNILPFGPGKNEQLSEERLLAWQEGKLSPAEQHEVEQWLADEGMESDAMEGLKESGSGDTRHIVNKLNHDLRKTIASKKRRRKLLKTQEFTLVAIAIVLLLAVLAYIVIRKSL